MIISVITNNQLPSYETPASAGMDVRATFEHIVEKFLFNTTISRHDEVYTDENGEIKTTQVINYITINNIILKLLFLYISYLMYFPKITLLSLTII